MSNETEEIEPIFDEIRALADELGLETARYVGADLDESVLGKIIGGPRSRVRRRVAGGLAALAVAASAVTVLTVGTGDPDRPDPEALSASLAAPSIDPDSTSKSQLDSDFSANQSDLQSAQEERAGGKLGPALTLDDLVMTAPQIILVEGDPPRVVEVLAGFARTSGSPLVAAPELRTGLRSTGRLLYFLQDRPGRTSMPIVPPYAEASPGRFVATAPVGGAVRGFTTAELAEAIAKR